MSAALTGSRASGCINPNSRSTFPLNNFVGFCVCDYVVGVGFLFWGSLDLLGAGVGSWVIINNVGWIFGLVCR